MVDPITIGLGVASLAGGLMGGRAQDRARRRARRQERAEIGLQQQELADAQEAFTERQDRIARSIANALANRGISSSSIAEEAKQQFVGERARGQRVLDRQAQRLQAGITSRNIQNDLQQALQRANQLQSTIGLVGLLAQGFGGASPTPGAPGIGGAGTQAGGQFVGFTR